MVALHASDMPAFVALLLVVSTSILDVYALPVRSVAKAMSSSPAARDPPVLSLPPHRADKQAGMRKKSGLGNHRGDKKEPGTSNRRSILIPHEGGSSYVITKTRDYNQHDQQVLTARGADNLRRCLKRRQTASVNGLPGTIDIIAYSSNSSTGDGWKLASLQVAPSDSKTNTPFVLNASNSTQPAEFSLVNDGNGAVRLVTPVYDKSTGAMKAFCASYDPSPPEPESMVLETCGNKPSSSGLSQTFRYNEVTGEITPMWTAGADNSSSPDAPIGNNSSDYSSGSLSNGGTSSNGTDRNTRAIQTSQPMQQKIAMVFTPSIPTYTETMDDPGAGSDDAPSNVTTSATSTITSLGNSIGPHAVTITMSSMTTGDSSTTSSTSTSNASSAQETLTGPLNVDVVGPNAPPSPSKEMSSTAVASATSSPTTTSMNAEQIAASIANDAEVTTTIPTSAGSVTPMPTAQSMPRRL